MTMMQKWRSGWGLIFRAALFFGCIRLVLIPMDALDLLLPDRFEELGQIVTILYALLVIPLCAPFLAALSGVEAAFTGFFEKTNTGKQAPTPDKVVHPEQ